MPETDAAVEAARTEDDTAKDVPDYEEHVYVSTVSALDCSPLSALIDTPDSSHKTRPASVRLDQSSSTNFTSYTAAASRTGGRDNVAQPKQGLFCNQTAGVYFRARSQHVYLNSRRPSVLNVTKSRPSMTDIHRFIYHCPVDRGNISLTTTFGHVACLSMNTSSLLSVSSCCILQLCF